MPDESINFQRGDKMVIQKVGGNAELVIENATRDVAGFLFNKGGGETEFRVIEGATPSAFGIFLDPDL